MRPLPILLEADPHNIVGKLSIINGEYIVEFMEPINADLLFTCGYEMLDCEFVGDKCMIKKIKLYSLIVSIFNYSEQYKT